MASSVKYGDYRWFPTVFVVFSSGFVFFGYVCGVLRCTAILPTSFVVSSLNPPLESVADDVSSNKEDPCLVFVGSSPYPGSG